MTTGSISDRRQFAQERLAAMAEQPSAERDGELRRIAASVLGFSPTEVAVIAPAHPLLPQAATVLATLPNRYGPDYLAVHFDLSTRNSSDTRSYVTNAQVQAANAVAQQYARDEHYPLLVFTLPDNSGVQFVTGNPEPGNRYRLRDIARVTAYWHGQNRTALDCLENVGSAIANGGVPQQAFKNAFDVQPVTSEFFEDYKNAYETAVGQIAPLTGRPDAEQFTQTLFNRLLFVHFVSRKGWLQFKNDTDYLNALWSDYTKDEKNSNFYTAKLETLFFEGLNNPQYQDLNGGNKTTEKGIGIVPFLNGGLFDRTPLDDRAAAGEFAVPDDIIEHVITRLFNRYNFTVMEATPIDTEVAVDPEMLGKLFEETVNERHSNGAYYTPRPVVAFMCREAIKGYLEGRNIADLTPAAIEDLVDNANPQAVTVDQAREIANAVAAMKAVDPACGSGAFLLGMLQEILAVNGTIFAAAMQDPDSLYRQKLNIISNNIYGADKDALAVSTAMLRLWLSLAVDYDGLGTPDPLPNLDMKLIIGDAISGPNPEQKDFTLQEIEKSELQRNTAEYTTAHGSRKEDLKHRIEKDKADIGAKVGDAAPEGIVEWRIDFAEVILNGGFDIVVANPPYVRQEDIGRNKAALVNQYTGAVTARSDLYCYFYARGLQLLKDDGLHVFVCSNSWLDVGYGAKLQEYLLNNAHVQAVYESAVERQFATADINTIVSIIRKTNSPADGDTTKFVSLRSEFSAALADASARREIVRSRAALRAAGRDGNKHVGDKWGGKYLRAPDIYHAILDNHGDKLVRLGDVATVRFGIKTGANEFFYLTPERIAEFGIEPGYYLPVMTTPQESRRIAVDPTTLPKRLFMCHDDKDALKGTGALAYIQWGESQGYHKRTSVKSRKRWYDLGQWDASQLALNYVIDTTARTYYFQGGCLVPNVFHTVQSNANRPLQLCGALNSTLAQLIINLSGRANLGGGALKLELYELASLQLVNPTLLPEPHETIFNAADWDVLNPSAARRHIDAAVYDALGLTVGEREAVHAGMAELVSNRKRRAGSVSGAGGAGAKERQPFAMTINHSGLAPGATPENMKDIIFDQEDEEFLEKLSL